MSPSPAPPHRARRLLRHLAPILLLLLVAGPARAAEPKVVVVRSLADLRRALADAGPGTRVRVAAGTYEGGVHVVGAAGAPGRPLVVEAEDPKHPPLFRGGGTGLQWTDAAHVEVIGLAFEGQTGNGVNFDDGGTPATPAHHVVLRDLTVRDVGPEGNHDGIKLSGLEDFLVTGCVVERWGRGGSAVDMVGCRRGVIEGCRFRHEPGLATGSGVQAKGGTNDVTIRRNRFEEAGSRAVNVGGSTGLEFFRPPLDEGKGPRYEAKDVRVEGNTFLGGTTPVAFVGADGGTFVFNTVHVPGRWTLRILQENRAPGFVACREGVFAHNLVVFRSDRWSEGGVNVGPDTAPGTFRFEANLWYCTDAPTRTRDLVRLPSPERKGTYDVDPRLRDPAGGDLRPKAEGVGQAFGAEAYLGR